MDLIRTILLRVEALPQFAGCPDTMGAYAAAQEITATNLGITDFDDDAVRYNASLLIDGGFLEGEAHAPDLVTIYKLTWNGHEFLDSIRNADVWQKTKDKAKTVGGVALGFLWEIAKAEMRAKLGLP